MHTQFVLDALEQALYARQAERDGELIHHSNRGLQYVSVRYGDSGPREASIPGHVKPRIRTM
jgi:transposase InsO family protein